MSCVSVNNEIRLMKVGRKVIVYNYLENLKQLSIIPCLRCNCQMGLQDWRVICVTYNVNARQAEDDQIHRILRHDDADNAVIVAIGLQVHFSLLQIWSLRLLVKYVHSLC